MENSKVLYMKFSKISPLLVSKAKRKNRTNEEVNLQLKKDVTYQTFFDEAPLMNPNCELIKGSICGVRVENIEDPFIRYLDKLIDEVKIGKAMNKILRYK